MANSSQFVKINGQTFDKSTGQPSSGSVKTTNHSNSIHKRTIKSKTLHPAARSSKTQPSKPNIKVQGRSTRQEQHKESLKADLVKKHSSVERFPTTTEYSHQSAPLQQAAPAAELVTPQHSSSDLTMKQRKDYIIAQNLAQIDAPMPEELDTEEKKAKPLFTKMQFKSLLAGSAAALLFVGYITYLNVPSISLRVAASKAGFDAQLPGYTPKGYSYTGQVTYAPGKVSLTYKNSDSTFLLTQKESDWDSSTLLSQYVTQQSDQYITFQEKGLTIYTYNNANAAWMNGGIWYTLEADDQLSSDQLLSIATSF